MSRGRVVAIACCLALSATACVKNKAAEPGVRAITTDLQYKQLQEKNAAPPNMVPVAQPALGLPTIPPFGSYPPEVPTGVGTCPTAAPTEQAQEDVTLSVSKMPDAGQYLWKIAGSELVGKTRLGLPTQSKRTIEHVTGSVNGDTAELSYETVERELSASNPAPPTVRSYFNVTSKTLTDNTVREQGQSSGRTSTAGVRLMRVDTTDPTKGTTTFIPSQPIRYLITPVLEGPERFWQDQVVDTSGSSNQSLVHKAYVKGRTTIDACGKRIRGWLVVADQTYSSGGNAITRHFEYAVATQMGGIVISEYVESPCTKQGDGTCSEGKPVLTFDASYGKKLG